MRRSHLLLDTSPLRESVPYRYFFWGQLVSLLGTQLTTVALPLQVYVITHSSLAVGLIGLVQLAPALILTLAGGTLADAFDRRSILIVTQLLLLLLTAALAIVTMIPHPSLWLLYVLAGLLAGVAGVGAPARGAMIRNLVRAEIFPAAAALNGLMGQIGAMVGPALAGLLITYFNLSLAYWVDAATYGAALLAILLLPAQPPEGGGRAAGWVSLKEGLLYLRGRPVLQGILLIDMDAMIFGMPRALFPAFGLTVFHGGAQAVGLLYAAPAAGALLGAVGSGWVGRVKRPGRAVLMMVVLWGVAATLFGLSPWLPVALLMLTFAGWADMISEVLRSSMLQLSIPDDLRGRITAVWLAQANGAPRLGDVESGLVAAATTAQVSAATGGIACVLGALALAWLLPAFGRFQYESLEPTT